jgi:hypothetical protein
MVKESRAWTGSSVTVEGETGSAGDKPVNTEEETTPVCAVHVGVHVYAFITGDPFRVVEIDV